MTQSEPWVARDRIEMVYNIYLQASRFEDKFVKMKESFFFFFFFFGLKNSFFAMRATPSPPPPTPFFKKYWES